MSDLLKKEFGDADLELKFSEGKLRLMASIDTKGVDGGVFVDLEPDYFLDKLAEAIPGNIDDAVIAMLKAAFKSA